MAQEKHHDTMPFSQLIVKSYIVIVWLISLLDKSSIIKGNYV
jgi:hypothetical protein